MKRFLIQFAGMCLSVGPLLKMFVTVLTRGPRAFRKKDRLVPPAILKDLKWNQNEGFVRVSPEVKIHYVEKGDRNKPLMLFLHGFPEFWFSWRYQIEHFAKDYHCVAIDMRGFNESDKPEGIEAYGLNYLADDVKAVIEGLNKNECILVGHDWGGSVGYAFCATYPEMVKCYIVCNLPHPRILTEEQQGSLSQALKSWYMIFIQCPKVPEWYFKIDDYSQLETIVKEIKHANSDEIVEAYKYAYNDPRTVTASLNYYRCAAQYPRSGKAMRKPVTVPVKQIFGVDDKYIGVDAARKTKKYVENLDETYIEGAGHWVQMEAAEKVNQTMEEYLAKISI